MTIKDAARQLDINDKNVNKIFRFYHEEQKTQKSLIRFQLRILARELLNIKLLKKGKKKIRCKWQRWLDDDMELDHDLEAWK